MSFRNTSQQMTGSLLGTVGAKLRLLVLGPPPDAVYIVSSRAHCINYLFVYTHPKGTFDCFSLNQSFKHSLVSLFSQEAKLACVTSEPEYDLELSCKVQSTLDRHNYMTKGKLVLTSSFLICFAFKSVSDYCYVECCTYTKRWSLYRVISLDGPPISIAEIRDDSIRPNIFYHVLLQVRGPFVSLDVDAVPIFTKIRMTKGEHFGGLMGLISKVCHLVLTKLMTDNTLIPI